MNETPHRSANSEFTFDPTNKVVGSIDAAGDARDAMRDLTAAGFAATEVELLTDQGGAARIDMSGEGHEAMVHVHIFDATQKVPAFYDSPVIVRRVEKELRASHYLIGVVAKDGEARERAREILKSHGGHFINFYGRFAAEGLEP
ncbi:MAG TPA: hypothetical protein VN644_10260 [Pyrinomonadaceae bacterium]|jgi:hypothetical protein|nr:hypothetical protein [Pyrinomonadaceae bacterium]